MNLKSQYLFRAMSMMVLLVSFISTNQPAHASASSVDKLDMQISDHNSPEFQDSLQVQPTISLAITPQVITLGEMATVAVNLNNVPAEGYTSIEIICTYYPDLVEAKDIVVADLFGADPVVAIRGPQSDHFIVAIAGSQGNKATNSGTVMTFHVRGLQRGLFPLECQARVSTGDQALTEITSISNDILVLGPTPTSTTGFCDSAEFIADVNVPPGTVMAPGAQFRKTWRLMNVGTCTWTTSYQLVFFSGEQMGTLSSFNFPVSVSPGQAVDLSLDMAAPSTAGSYTGNWIFKNANGALFGIGPQANEPFSVDIIVSGETATPSSPTNSPTPSVTPDIPSNTPSPSITPGGPTATPIAGVAYDFAANVCAAVWTSGAGQLPCLGIDGDPKGFVLRLNNPILETGLTDSRLGLLTFPQNIQNGYIQGYYPAIHVQNGDRFRSIITCEYRATNCYVAFRLDYQVGGDSVKTLWGPFLERYDGRHYSVDVDLSPLAGKDVKFILTILSGGSATGDRALWVGPIIYRGDLVATATPSPTLTASHTPVPSSTPPIPSNFIQVTSPNGGEILTEGSTYRITWGSTSDIQTVYIGYKWSSSGMDWIAPGIPNIGYYDWKIGVGQIPTNQIKIYIYGYGTADTSDESDGFVTILKPALTDTPTMTPTASPTGMLSGQIIASKPVTISVYGTDHALVASVQGSLNNSFAVTLSGGTYTVVASASGFLNAQGSFSVTSNLNSTLPTITLNAGDIDGNNVIDQFDALTIGMSYNTSAPAAADLNNDGVINVLDLELLAQNYRKTGPVVWQ